jgi:hypothetical protein
MQSKATTVAAYLKSLPDDRRTALEAIRKVILKNLDKDYEEGMGYGMMGYYVPHSVYPPGYHCDPKQPLSFAGMASQKNHMSLYLMCIYYDPAHQAWFRKAWTANGRKLDMGKCCVRFRKLEDVPLKVVGEAIRRVPVKRLIAMYEQAREQTSAKAPIAKAAGAAKLSKARKVTGKGAGRSKAKSR